MRIESADVGDADIVADLWVELASQQQAFGTHLRPDANSDQIREDVLRRIITENVLVARGDVDGYGGIAGFVSFGLETRGYDQDVRRGIVYNIYVRPEWRNEGLGRELLAAAEDRLARAGAEAVALEVMAGNRDARRFYERNGYDPHRVELEKSLDSPEDAED